MSKLCLLSGFCGSFLLGFTSLGPASAQEQAGLVGEGARIAQEACADCHNVSGSKSQAGAPDFVAVARMPSTTATSIRVFLKTPHSDMPDIILAEREIDARAAYILSLAGR